MDHYLIGIWGDNFNNGARPVVTLGSKIPLIVTSYDVGHGQWIEATLPLDIEEGQYKLIVSTGEGHNCKDKHSVHIPHHEKPPCEPTCPEKCPETCPQSCKGEKGDQGLPGPPGITGWKIVTQQGDNVGHENEFRATATCEPGYKVTGGGFWQNDLDIRVNGPFEEIEQQGENGVVKVVLQTTNNGWYVSGTQKTGNNTTLIVYAICACVDPAGCVPPPELP